MTNEELALIEGIREEPWDDTRRLVYADWLEENGQDDRAELIRMQIPASGREKYPDHWRREREVSRQFDDEWCLKLGTHGVHFARGMGIGSWGSVEIYEHDSAILEQAGNPLWIVERTLQFSPPRITETRDIARLVSCRGFAHLTQLVINPTEVYTGTQAALIGQSEHTGLIHHLALNRMALNDTTMKALARSAHLGKLRRLNLSANRVTPTGFKALINSKMLKNVVELNLAETANTDEILESLAESSALKRLESLILTDCRIGDARLRTLLNAPWMPRLKTLTLNNNPIRDTGASELAACAAVANLRDLNLNDTQLTDTGALEILESPHLRKLKELGLGTCSRVSDGVKSQLGKRFGSVYS